MSSSLKDIRHSKAIENLWLYKTHNYSLLDFKKEFDFIKNPIYGTTHTKKQATLIEHYFLSKLLSFSKPYFYFFTQFEKDTSNLDVKENGYKELLKIEVDDIDLMISSINSLLPLKYNSSPYVQAYTTQESLRDYFLENFNVSLLVISQEELEEVGEQNPESIFVDDSYSMCFQSEYKPKEFENYLLGCIYNEEKNNILTLLDVVEKYSDELLKFKKIYFNFFNKEFDFDSSIISMKPFLEGTTSLYARSKDFVQEIKSKVNDLNLIVSKDLKSQTISLNGDEIVALLEQKTTSSLQEKISLTYKNQLDELKSFINSSLKELGIGPKSIFSKNVYPFELDEEELALIVDEASLKGEDDKRKNLKNLGSFMTLDDCDEIYHYCYFVLYLLILKREFETQNYNFVDHKKELLVQDLRHFFIPNPNPVSYVLKGYSCQGAKLNGESVALVTGANSGGKTTLVESIIQATILSSFGFPCKIGKGSSIPRFKTLTYLKKFTGTQGSGAFEQTLKQLLELLEDDDENVLIIIDELEAVTEPGAAAKILLSFLRELSFQNKYCITISHLGEELELLSKQEKITNLRIDGISATGLDDKGNLITNHQPEFYSRGKSTPELIMKRVLRDEAFWKDKSSRTKEIFKSLVDKEK